MADLRIITADVLDGLAQLEPDTVQCVVTSPPYWSLRDYGVAGQIGLEPTLGEYVEKMVGVFREVRRVLRSDGTLWLNMGDSYNAYNGGAGPSSQFSKTQSEQRPHLPSGFGLQRKSLKTKDLIGIPWRVALALQAAGWYLRSDIIWSKPSPMPESVTDRPTRAHEYIFLLTKARRYYYDADAVREGVTGNAHPRGDGVNPKAQPVPTGWDTGPGTHRAKTGRYPKSKQNASFSGAVTKLVSSRNLRTVWTIASQPYPEAHFATFPTALPETCIRAGTSAWGCCAECGAPWVRVVEKTYHSEPTYKSGKESEKDRIGEGRNRNVTRMGDGVSIKTTDWQPACDHDAARVPCTVLDPFAGAGTTLLVARALHRHAIGIELNPEYADLARKRCSRPWELPAEPATDEPQTRLCFDDEN